MVCVLALGLLPFTSTVGCNSGGGSSEGLGGSGGVAPFCEADLDCDDQEECTSDACNQADGLCEHSSLPEGSPCDGDAGACRIGQCVPTQLKAFLEPPLDTQPDARFGTSVAIAGDRMVVGSPGTTAGFGRAVVYDRPDTDWGLAATLEAPALTADGLYGWSVALNGPTPLIGSAGGPGRALGTPNDGTGSVRAIAQAGIFAYIRGSDVVAAGLQYQEYAFGASIGVSGGTLVVGAPSHYGPTADLDPATPVVGTAAGSEDPAPIGSGAAYVFISLVDTGVEQAFLKASNAGSSYVCDLDTFVTSGIGDAFGASVAISGDTIAVGAPGEDSAATGIDGAQDDSTAAEAGAVYIFERGEDDSWTQTAYVKASNTNAGDRFGFSVDLDGDTLVVGAEREDSAATGVDGDEGDNDAEEAGAAYVFERAGGVWAQTAYLKASNSDAGYFFGANVAIDGDTILIGSPGESSIGGENSGAAYVFSREAGSWAETNFLKAFNAQPEAAFAGPPGILDTSSIASFPGCAFQNVTAGNSLALEGNTILVGAPFLDGTAGSNSGAVYVFENE